MRDVLRLLALVVCCGCMPATAAAQQTVTDIINFLVTNQTVPTADFERDQAAAEAARDSISRALLVNLASVPLGTSSGGFLYRLNPQLGTMERASESFGAFFVERALTAGAGQASLGVAGYTAGFNRLNGANLRDGSFVTVANQFIDESTPFDTDSLTLRVRTNTLTVFGAFGITDALEVGAAVPFVQLRVDGERQNVYFGDPFVQASGSATASGLGDIALRAKYRLLVSDAGAFAVAGEMRLPTGDDANLLGAGSTTYRMLAIGSYDAGRFGLHGNGGVVFGGASDEFNLAGAATYAVRPTVTLTGEMLMRRVSELRELTLVSAPHPTKANVDTLRLAAGADSMTLTTAVAGMKWNLRRTLVLGAHVAFPLARRGLTSTLTPTVSLEYGF
jgi:hypothetical protein